jgi:hypothetical protein
MLRSVVILDMLNHSVQRCSQRHNVPLTFYTLISSESNASLVSTLNREADHISCIKGTEGTPPQENGGGERKGTIGGNMWRTLQYALTARTIMDRT